MITEFYKIYNCFYSKITDDMYMELDKHQTDTLLEELLFNALPWFEFPRVNLYDYNLDGKYFNLQLTNEEINIISTYMVLGWISQQLASIELVRMKYSGSDFKFTSQANHMSKLIALKKEYERNGFHLQRLYKRRKSNENGVLKSTLGNIMSTSVREGIVNNNSSSSCDCPKTEIKWNDFSVEYNFPNNDWDSMSDLNVNNSNSNNDNDFWESM